MLTTLLRRWRALVAGLVVLAVPALPSLAAAPDDQVRATAPAQAFAGKSRAKTVRLAAAADRIAVRLRLRCGKATTARLTLDRRTVIQRRVTHRAFREVVVGFVTPPGRHRVALTAVGGRSGHCRKPLGNGAVRFLARASASGSGGVVSGTSGPAGGKEAPTDAAPSSTSPTPATPTTPTTPTTPAIPTPPVAGRPKLAWAPPALTSPTTIAVAQGDQRLTLNTAKDYIIKLGSTTHAGGLTLNGGRNVVIVGGRIALPTSSAFAVGLGISGAVGTVHVEGVWIDGASGHEFDGVQISAPKATVQLQNIRATGLRGSYDTNHTDIVQPWGGVAKLRIDRLTGSSNYQGIFNQPDQGPIGSVDLRHVNLGYDDVGAKTGGYMLWLTNGCSAATTALSDVYVKGRPGATLGSTVWPPAGGATDCEGILSSALTIGWPSLPVTGIVRWGTPAAGSFVTTADAGASYRTPGYG
jgi:hypothetical protein